MIWWDSCWELTELPLFVLICGLSAYDDFFLKRAHLSVGASTTLSMSMCE